MARFNPFEIEEPQKSAAEREREQRRQMQLLERERAREYRARGIETDRDVAGRVFPVQSERNRSLGIEGMVPDERGMIDWQNTRKQLETDIFSRPPQRDSEIDREISELRTRRTGIGQFIAGREKQLEQFDKEQGFQFKKVPGGEEGEVEDVSETGLRVRRLAEQKGETLGFFGGIFRPGKQGDPTPEAIAARQKLDSDPELKRYRLALEKRGRMLAEIERARQAYAEAEIRLGELQGKKHVPEFFDESPEHDFDDPLSDPQPEIAPSPVPEEAPAPEPVRAPYEGGAIVREGDITAPLPQGYRREAEPAEVAGFIQIRDVPLTDADRAKQGTAAVDGRPYSPEQGFLADSAQTQGDTPEPFTDPQQTQAPEIPDTDPYAAKAAADEQRMFPADPAASEQDQQNEEAPELSEPEAPTDREAQFDESGVMLRSGYVRGKKGEDLLFIDDDGRIYPSGDADPREAAARMVELGVSRGDAEKILTEAGWIKTGKTGDFQKDFRKPTVQDRMNRTLKEDERPGAPSIPPLRTGMESREIEPEPIGSRWNPEFQKTFESERERIQEKLRKEVGNTQSEGFWAKFSESGWDASFGNLIDLAMRGISKAEDLEVPFGNPDNLTPAQIREKATMMAHLSLAQELVGLRSVDREAPEGFKEKLGTAAGFMAGLMVDPVFRSASAALRGPRAVSVALPARSLASSAGRGAVAGAKAGAAFAATHPPVVWMPEKGEFSEAWANQAVHDIAGFAAFGAGGALVARMASPLFWKSVNLKPAEGSAELTRIGQKYKAGHKLTPEEAKLMEQFIGEVRARAQKGDFSRFDPEFQVWRPREWVEQVPFLNDLVRTEVGIRAHERGRLGEGSPRLTEPRPAEPAAGSRSGSRKPGETPSKPQPKTAAERVEEGFDQPKPETPAPKAPKPTAPTSPKAEAPKPEAAPKPKTPVRAPGIRSPKPPVEEPVAEPAVSSPLGDRVGTMVRERLTDLPEMVVRRSEKGVLMAVEQAKYNDFMHPKNAETRAIFEELTGVKLPKTAKETREFFDARKGEAFPLVETVVPASTDEERGVFTAERKRIEALSEEEFEKEYREAFEAMNRYTPDQVGSRMWAERMATMEEIRPEWVEKIEAKSDPKPEEILIQKWKEQGVEVKLADKGDVFSFDLVKVPEDRRRQGIGSQVVEDVKALADEQGKPVELVVVNQRDWLPDFYRTRGFSEFTRINPKTGKPYKSDAVAMRYTPASAEGKAVEQVSAESVETGSSPVVPTTDSTVAKVKTEEQSPPSIAAASEIQEILSSGPLDSKTLNEVMTRHFGGTMAEGKYSVKDSYDVMEMGINLKLSQDPGLAEALQSDNPAEAIARIRQEILERIPTQTKRTLEQDKMQQFSTPPHLSFAANWVARPGQDDIYLEPSAGVGGLSVYGRLAKARVIANEFSNRRADMLQASGLADTVLRENAENLHSILEPRIARGEIDRPTVVVMNPPFSNAAKSGKTRRTMIGAQHVEEALKVLEPGGRLVAIVGRGMAADAPTFRGWWNRIGKQYQVRANIGVSGKEYRKYGTSFDNRMLVIDKPLEGQEGGSETIIRDVDSIEELFDILKEVRDERPVKTSAQPSGPRSNEAGKDPTPARPDAAGDTDVRPPSDGRPGGTRSGGSASVGGSGSSNVRPQSASDTGDGGRKADQGKSSEGQSSGVVRGDRPRSDLKLEKKSSAKRKIELEDGGVFADYSPSKVSIKGAQKHPAKLVESAAMASVEPPDPHYTPNIPEELIKSGALSDAQLENIVYAGQAHLNTLPSGERKGYFIGDGTGVGKGREIAGIILDNFRQGRKKAVWVSKTGDLIKAAKGDVSALGMDPAQVIPLSKVKANTGKIENDEGILFAGYATLMQGHEGLDERGKAISPPNGKSRLQQVVDWLGEDFDGVIAFDESHKAGNAIPMKGKRGIKKPSKTGISVVDLQRMLPKARVVYVSATGATNVENLAYATRLGIWGPGTSFTNVEDFVTKVQSAGISGMEIVARDLKALGSYLARSISYKGVKFDRIEQVLTKDQREMYDQIARAWQIVFQNMSQALASTGAANNSRARGAAGSAFYGSQQRFFNQLLTSMEMPAILKDMEVELNKGNSPVLQIVNTNEAIQKRQVAQASTDEGDSSLEDLDLSPRDILLQYLDKSFPTMKYEEVADPNNPDKTMWIPVRDSEGNFVEDPEAVRKKLELMDSIALLRIPDNPLEMILDQFGADTVAEITGRSQRLVMKKQDDGTMKRVLERRSPAKRSVEAEEFQNGKRRILIFSDAGGTGFSFHASNTVKNQSVRVHYLVQAGWRADNALQGFGRTHRSNQAQPPFYKLVQTDIKGHKRFISTIARRLEQLGALTSGERKSTGQGLFSALDNLESEYAEDALSRLIRDIINGQVEDWTTQTFSMKMGFGRFELDSEGETVFVSSLVNENTGEMNVGKFPDIPQFLNRLLALELADQGTVFDAFMDRLERRIEKAKSDGTYDPGTQTYKAQEIHKISDEVVYEHPDSTAKTRIVEIEAINPEAFTQFEEISALGSKPVEHYVRNRRSGRIYALKEGPPKTKQDGSVVDTWRRIGTRTVDVIERNTVNINPGRTVVSEGKEKIVDQGNYESLTYNDARDAWDTEIAEADKVRRTREHFIVGAFLPIWDRIKIAPRIFRFTTSDGENLLGSLIPPKALPGVRSRLGVSQKMTGEQVYHLVLEENARFTLANDWAVRRSRVSGEDRIEVVGPQPSDLAEFTDHIGGFVERIGWQPRFFIPSNVDQGVPALEKLIAKSPPVEMNGQNLIGDGDAPAEMGAPSGGGRTGGGSAGSSGNPDFRVDKRTRIQVAPIKGGKPKPIGDIVLDFTKAAKVKLRVGKTKRGLSGSYYPGSRRTVVRAKTDFNLVGHEIAHNLDDLYGIVAKWAALETSPFDRELEKFWIHGSVTERGPRSKPIYKRAEGVAEWIRAYIVNPEEALKQAPKFADYFLEQVPANVLQAIDRFSREIREFAGLPAHDRTLQNIEFDLSPSGPIKRLREAFRQNEEEFSTNWLDELNVSVIDSLAPVWKGMEFAMKAQGIEELMPADSPKVLARLMAGHNRKTMDVFAHGMIKANGDRVEGLTGGISALFAPFDKSSTEALEKDIRDMFGLMVNERIIERARQIDETWADRVRSVEVKRLKGIRDAGELSLDEYKEQVKILNGAKTLAEIEEVIDREFWKDRFPKIVRRADREKSQLAGTGGGIFKDHEQAAEALNDLLAEPERLARLREGARLYRAWADSLLRYMRDKGRISQAQYQQIKDKNEYYIAMQRLQEEVYDQWTRGLTGKNLARAKKTLHKFKGSMRTIRNPYVNLMEQTSLIIRESDRNEVLLKIRNLLTNPRGMYQGKPINLDSVGSRAEKGDRNTIKIFLPDGREEYWQFEKGIHRALNDWFDVHAPSLVEKAAQIFPRLMHTAIVHTPSFVIRSTLKDPLQRSIVSRAGGKPLDSFHWLTPSGMKEYREMLSRFNRDGGGLFGHYNQGEVDYYKELRRFMKKETSRRNPAYVFVNPMIFFRGWHELAANAEIMGRVTEYRRAVHYAKNALGYDDLNARLWAAYQARDITDYAVSGRVMKGLNRYVPFTTAAIRGLMRTVEGLQGSGGSGGGGLVHPGTDAPGGGRGGRGKRIALASAGIAARWLAYLGSVSALVWIWNQMMGDDEEYWQQPDYVRDMFWLMKVGPDTWLAFPKPWELGTLASGVERGMEYASGNEKAFEGFATSMRNMTTPIDEQAILGPFRAIGEVAVNRDLFRDRMIVPPWEEDLLLEKREGTKRASRLGQFLQEAIGLDARYIDHFLGAQFGDFGRYAQDISDAGREDKRGVKDMGRRLIGLIRSSPAWNARDVQWVFDYARSRGIQQSQDVRDLRDLLSRYNDAETASEKDAAAKRAREYATRLRERYERDSERENRIRFNPFNED